MSRSQAEHTGAGSKGPRNAESLSGGLFHGSCLVDAKNDMYKNLRAFKNLFRYPLTDDDPLLRQLRMCCPWVSSGMYVWHFPSADRFRPFDFDCCGVNTP